LVGRHLDPAGRAGRGGPAWSGFDPGTEV